MSRPMACAAIVLAFVVGWLVGALPFVHAAEPSRPAATVVLPGRAPDGQAASRRTGPTLWRPAATSPVASPGTKASSAVTDPNPSVTPKPKPKPARAILRGRASWVRSDLGDRYLAARLPKGTHLRICGPAGCWSGTVNDYGPSKRIHPERIVDLSRAAFSRVCGAPSMGVCSVRVSVR